MHTVSGILPFSHHWYLEPQGECLSFLAILYVQFLHGPAFLYVQKPGGLGGGPQLEPLRLQKASKTRQTVTSEKDFTVVRWLSLIPFVCVCPSSVLSKSLNIGSGRNRVVYSVLPLTKTSIFMPGLMISSVYNS